MNEEFNNLVNLFKKLTTDEKKDALIKEFKLNLAALEKINNDIGVKHNMIFNSELLDINNENANIDDYLEAYFVYLYMINDLMGSFASKVANDFFE